MSVTHIPQGTPPGTFDFAVVTTAALPWRTGPAYLSLWHACGLAALGYRVAYIIPWLSPRSQRRLWGKVRFSEPADQYAWLAQEAERIGCPALPELAHYRGHYTHLLRSIVPLHSVFASVPPSRSILLEEPEHLCWHPTTPPRRRIAAEQVAGVVMTHYPDYVARSPWPGAGALARLVTRFHRGLIRRHTDQVFLISPAVALPGLEHPVREARITGVLAPYHQIPPVREQTRGVYFLGRLVWDKGLEQLLQIARRSGISVDIYGDGPDGPAIAARARELNAPVRLLGPSASPWEQLPAYRVFLNPSPSEVLCTATADALVAGRHAILLDCPANRPFFDYPNAHRYTDLDGAVAALQRTLQEAPQTPTQIRHDFDWMNACRTLAALCGPAAAQ